VLRVIEMHQGEVAEEILTQEIMTAYFSWLGKCVCTQKKEFKVDRRNIPKLRIGYTSNKYWHKGGCAIVGVEGVKDNIVPFNAGSRGSRNNKGALQDYDRFSCHVYGNGCSYY
jgi:hypothetical protein